ncbi:hypothetical protein D3C72_1836080 [compost metagenome]
MNAFVPERAIVPSASIISSRFMPMPLSSITSVCASSLSVTRIPGWIPSEESFGFEIDSYRSFSQASAAFEINSRRNTSLSE